MQKQIVAEIVEECEYSNEKIIWLDSKPENIRCDNGSEFISKDFHEWCKGNDIIILYARPIEDT